MGQMTGLSPEYLALSQRTAETLWAIEFGHLHVSPADLA
jgi:hypothetical protein